MLADAIDRKAARAGWPKGKADADAPLAGRVLAMIFEKNSTRTRVSFDMAIRQLGGQSIVMEAGQMQLGRGETVADTARVLSGYVDAIMIRTDDHAKVVEMAEYASVPVINGLTDYSHPCQIVADLQAIIESGPSLPGLKVAWLGDGNNVLASMMEAAGLMQFDVVAACPQGFMPPDEDVALGKGRARVVGHREGSGRGRRHRRHRHLDLDGPGSCRHQAGGDDAVSGDERADGGGEARRQVPPLPPRASWRGSDGGGDRRPAIVDLARGGKPPPRAEIDSAAGASARSAELLATRHPSSREATPASICR